MWRGGCRSNIWSRGEGRGNLWVPPVTASNSLGCCLQGCSNTFRRARHHGYHWNHRLLRFGSMTFITMQVEPPNASVTRRSHRSRNMMLASGCPNIPDLFLETPRYRGISSATQFRMRWRLTGWLRMQSDAKRSRGRISLQFCDLQGDFQKLQGEQHPLPVNFPNNF